MPYKRAHSRASGGGSRPAASDFLAAVYSDLGEDGMQILAKSHDCNSSFSPNISYWRPWPLQPAIRSAQSSTHSTQAAPQLVKFPFVVMASNSMESSPCYRLVLSAPNTDLHHPFKLNLIDIFSGSHFFQSAGDHILVCPLGDVALLAGHLKLHALPATNDLKKHHAEAVDIYLNSYRRKPYGSTMQYAKFKMKSVIFQGDVGEVTQSVAQDETKGGK
uniref:Uncharacterized protein n=2 Tax=Oryza TaxID=4527 RepID=A0A0E0ASI1_9ORYZ